MITKSALCIPIGLMMLVAGAGCGGAPADSEGAALGEPPTVADEAAPQTPTPENVGKTQEQQLGWPGAGFGVGGFGVGAPLGFGFGAPLGFGAGWGGFGMGAGFATGMNCVNGFCTGF